MQESSHLGYWCRSLLRCSGHRLGGLAKVRCRRWAYSCGELSHIRAYGFRGAEKREGFCVFAAAHEMLCFPNIVPREPIVPIEIISVGNERLNDLFFRLERRQTAV